jgi:HEAT repeat protein
MRKRFRILLVVLLVAVLGGLAWQVLRPREPVYEGKTLSAWLADSHHMAEAQEAREAVHKMGTNTFPTLLRMLRKRDSDLKLRLVRFARKQHFITIRFISASKPNEEAVAAFRILGAEGKGAVPGLIEIYDQHLSPKSQMETANALAWIGPAAQSAVPSLLRETNNTNNQVRANALRALGLIHAAPNRVVPVLIKALSEHDHDVRSLAAQSLGYYQAEAKCGVPALTELLRDRSALVREIAGNSLRKIDPEAAAKAGVK